MSGVRRRDGGREVEGGRQGTMAKIQSEEFALDSGKIKGATALAANGVEPMMIQREGRWSSDAFITYARGNLKASQSMSTSLVRSNQGGR